MDKRTTKQGSSVSLPPKTCIPPTNNREKEYRLMVPYSEGHTEGTLDHKTQENFIEYSPGKNVSYGPKNSVCQIA
jgi:hypothetical protein